MIKVMTRKEEIKKGAFDAFPNEGWERQRVAFVQGALWADEYPRKCLVDIEKVCKVLNSMLAEVTYFDKGSITEHYDKLEFIEDFRKAMKE